MRPFDAFYILKSLLSLAPFIGITMLVTLLSILGGSFLGAVLAWARLSKFHILHIISAVYVHIIRSTPSIVLLFIVYYGLPKLIETLTNISTGYNGKLLYVTLTLTLLFSAPMCELFRTAYSSVDSGQKEAAFCCGFTSFQTAYFIIIPQALAAGLPVFCNEIINLLKQGALAFTIGFLDIMGQADIMVARAYGAHALETYIALAIIYWIISIIIEQILGMIEQHFSRGLSISYQDDTKWH